MANTYTKNSKPATRELLLAAAPRTDAVLWLAIARRLGDALRVLRHPFDVFASLRVHPRGAIGAAAILAVLALGVLLAAKLAASYLFGGAELNDLNPLSFLLRYSLPWATWVIANYLVGSIMKGQGKLSEVFVGSAYALMPVIVFALPLALISNLLTFSEGAIYDTVQLAVNGWVLLLLFIMVKEVHNYELGEALRNMVVSVLLILAIWLLTLIFIGLTYQLYDFAAQLYKEVAAR